MLTPKVILAVLLVSDISGDLPSQKLSLDFQYQGSDHQRATRGDDSSFLGLTATNATKKSTKSRLFQPISTSSPLLYEFSHVRSTGNRRKKAMTMSWPYKRIHMLSELNGLTIDEPRRWQGGDGTIGCVSSQ